MQEPALPTGYPDIVGVYSSEEAGSYGTSRARLTPAHLRVLQHLVLSKGADLVAITSTLRISARQVQLLVSDLFEADLIRLRGRSYAAQSLDKIFVAKRIVAVEAKVRDWRTAIAQAVANTWFASHSYVLLPVRPCVEAALPEARRMGVGVLVFDGRRTSAALEAEPRRIPASYGSWLVNEWALARLHAGQ